MRRKYEYDWSTLAEYREGLKYGNKLAATEVMIKRQQQVVLL